MKRWYFWVLAPVMLGSAAIVAFTTDPPTIVGKVVAYAFAVTLVLATLGLAAPTRFGWALRCVAGAILLATVAYVGSEAWGCFAQGKAFGLGGRRSDTNLFNALMAFVVFGLPALRYVVTGWTGTTADVIAVAERDADAEPRERHDGPDAG